jgi:hypothetical protein
MRGKGTGNKGEGARAKESSSIDSLYQLPLTEFTPARNALAARLKKSGRVEDAEEVRSLVKPSISAWAANQVYWQHRDTFDRLIAAGERLRKAQSTTLSGKSADVRGALQAVRETLSELTRMAADALTEVGSNPSPGTMRAVTATLEALSAYGSIPDAPRPGRLVDDVDPPGFETLAALVPSGGSASGSDAPSKVLSFRQVPQSPKRSPRRATGEDDEERREEERKVRLAAAKAAVQEADRALRDAKSVAQQAQAALKKAAADAKDTEKAMVEAEQVLEKAAKDAHSSRQLARRLAIEAESAAQAVDEAERSLARAKKEVDEAV